jgi:hypothetical protein
MSRSSSSSLRVMPVNGAIDELTEAEFVAETPIALAVTLTDAENSPTFTYSLTSEDNLNQTAEADYTGALDGGAGITYNGPSGMANHLRVACDTLKLLEGSISPGNDDRFVPAIYVNSTLVSYFDTEDARAPNGGHVEELDTATVAEYHIDTIIQVNEGDVIRFVVQQDTESTVDVDVDDEANFFIS